jgi:biotin-(acetyl-CoA carboxylase) ligase
MYFKLIGIGIGIGVLPPNYKRRKRRHRQTKQAVRSEVEPEEVLVMSWQDHRIFVSIKERTEVMT